MSAPWSALLPLALVGTDRMSSALPRWPGEPGALITEAVDTASHPATGLLRAAAVLACCGLAGEQGQRLAAPLSPAPADPQAALSDPQLVTLADWTLRAGPPRLQQELLDTLAQADLRLPPALLPVALDLSRRTLALRPSVAQVLGERGRWLASWREDWRHAAGPTADADPTLTWEQGSLVQRQALLRQQRLTDPEAARERLQASLPELPARERAQLAELLATGLSEDDAPLLDTLRRDRSREVREVALKLLLRLPQAEHPRRAAARLAALLSHERALLRKRWVLTAPEQADSSWAADQIDAQRPQHESLGERAWWLYQIARQVPLSWWQAHTGMSAPELLSWAQQGDWAETLQRAWHEVLLAAPETDWAQALLNAWPASLKRHDTAAVLAVLPAPLREQHWQQQLQAGESKNFSALLSVILASSPAPQGLSPGLSATLLVQVSQRLPGMQAWLLHQQLPELLSAVHPEALAAWTRPELPADATPAWTELMHTVGQIAHTRAALAALRGTSSSSCSL